MNFIVSRRRKSGILLFLLLPALFGLGNAKSETAVRLNVQPEVCLTELSEAVVSERIKGVNTTNEQVEELISDQLEAKRSCLCTSSYQVDLSGHEATVCD